MDNFGVVYDNMIKNYNELERLMGSSYEKGDKEQFLNLSSIAKGMLLSQMELINAYCPSDMKESLISKVELKEATLSDALNDIREKAL